MDAQLDSAPCGFLTFTDEGIISSANTTLAEWLGYPVAELAGKRFESLLTIAGRIFYQTHFFPLLTLHGKADEIFLTLRCADGEDVPVLLNAKRKQGVDGFESHCILMPVYQRKEFEAELIAAKRAAQDALSTNERLQQLTTELEANKQELDDQLTRLSLLHADLARFSKLISHDLQEPARKILVFADIVERERSGGTRAANGMAIGRIRSAAAHMRDLVESLRQYVITDQPSSQPEPCDLSAIIESAKEKALAEGPAGDLIINAHPLPVIEGHCDQFSVLFYHLISNAIQSRKDDAPAEIMVAADSIQQNRYRNIKGKYHYTDFARITFSDRGKGFSPEHTDYIFHLFEKGRPEAPGAGFGLALCRKIVENHYGSITASSSPGEGTSFTILLPLKHPGVAAC